MIIVLKTLSNKQINPSDTNSTQRYNKLIGDSSISSDCIYKVKIHKNYSDFYK